MIFDKFLDAMYSIIANLVFKTTTVIDGRL